MDKMKIKSFENYHDFYLNIDVYGLGSGGWSGLPYLIAAVCGIWYYELAVFGSTN